MVVPINRSLDSKIWTTCEKNKVIFVIKGEEQLKLIIELNFATHELENFYQ